MLIYNNEIYENNYLYNAPYEIKIKSKLPIDEFIEKIRNGEKVSCYMQVERYCAIKDENDEIVSKERFENRIYNKLASESGIASINLLAKSIMSNPEVSKYDAFKLYICYEQYSNLISKYEELQLEYEKENIQEEERDPFLQSNEYAKIKEMYKEMETYILLQPDTFSFVKDMRWDDVITEKKKFFLKPKELTKILANFYGVMPTLVNHKEHSISELKQMSDIANDYWYYNKGENSPYQPQYDFIKTYCELEPIEKRIFDNSGISTDIKEYILHHLHEQGRHYTSNFEEFLHMLNTRSSNSPYTPFAKYQIKIYDLLNGEICNFNEYVISEIESALKNIDKTEDIGLKKIKLNCLKAIIENVNSQSALQHIISTVFEPNYINYIEGRTEEEHEEKLYRYTEEYFKMLRKNMYYYSTDKSKEIDLEEYFKDKNIENLTYFKSKLQEKMEEAFDKRYKFIPKIIDTLTHIARTESYSPNTIAALFERKNIGSIVKYKNPILIKMGIKGFDFRDIPEKTIKILDLHASKENIDSLIALNNWFKSESKNCSNKDLVNIIANCNSIPIISYAKKPLEIKQLTELGITSETMKEFAAAKNASIDIENYEEDYEYEFKDNKIEIKGAETGVKLDKYKAYILSPFDKRNFTVGYDTHCCQHYGGAGEDCVYLATSHPDAGIFVIENEKQEILAQAFIWVDKEKDTFVFDNIEFADFRNISQIKNILYDFCNQLPYTNIHMGLGYNEMNNIGKYLDMDELVEMPGDEDDEIYSDYNNAVALKENNKMLFEKTSERQSKLFSVPQVNMENIKYDIKNSQYYESLSFAEKMFIDKLYDIDAPFDEKELLKLMEAKEYNFSFKKDFIDTLKNVKNKAPEEIMAIYTFCPYLTNIVTTTKYYPSSISDHSDLTFLDDIASHLKNPNQFGIIYEQLFELSYDALNNCFKDTPIQEKIDEIIKNTTPQQLKHKPAYLKDQIAKLLLTEDVLKIMKLNIYYTATQQPDKKIDLFNYISNNPEKVLSAKPIRNNIKEQLIKEFHNYKQSIPFSINKLAFICQKTNTSVKDFMKLIDFKKLKLIDKYNNEQMLNLMLKGFNFEKLHSELIDIINSTVSSTNINGFLKHQEKIINLMEDRNTNKNLSIEQLISFFDIKNKNSTNLINHQEMALEEL